MNFQALKNAKLRFYSCRIITLGLLFFLCVSVSPSLAQERPKVLDAIVNLKAEAPPNARLSPVLGTFRQGSGIVIDNNGLILTIGYLILEASDVSITKSNGEIIPAQVVAYDYRSGLGLVRANKPLKVDPISLGDSAQIASGSENILVSLLEEPSIRPVNVVDIRQFSGFWEYLLEDAIFTTPIVSSFPGSALIDKSGALVGVGYLAVSDAIQGADQTPGNMFVPIDSLKPILEDLVEFGRRKGPARPWMGIYTEMERGHLIVTRLAEDGPAEKAGVLPNDIIVNMNGLSIGNMADLFTSVWSAGDAGIEIEIEILRSGELKDLKIKTEDRYQWLRLNPQSKYVASLHPN